jgi:uncharacterized protein
MAVKAHILVGAYPARTIEGTALHLTDPISFWGGISLETGRVTDTRSPQQGLCTSGTVLFIRDLRGSSSASSVLLELIFRRSAPAAIILHEPDAILALGALVSRELGWDTPPILRLPANQQAYFPDGVQVLILRNGDMDILPGQV